MDNIAIIPARCGSKGLKDKNIMNLYGKPLLAYTIEAAVDSGIFRTIMVSTDSKQYADISAKFGAETPFLRSEEYSTDTASSWDVIREVLIKYAEMGKEFNTFCLLQPTSPLRNSSNIIEAYKEYKDRKALALTSVQEVRYTPYNCNTLPVNQSMNSFYRPGTESLRRQDIPSYYCENGAIYIGDVDNFMMNGDFYKNRCYAYIMSELNSVDIDTELDFRYAEFLMSNTTT